MTVRELRERLAEFPDDREVVVQDDDGEVVVCENVEEGQFSAVGVPGRTRPPFGGSVYVVVSA